MKVKNLTQSIRTLFRQNNTEWILPHAGYGNTSIL